MESKSVHRPKLYAGAIILGFCLVAYLTAAQPEVGIMGAVGRLIVSLFQIALLVVGLSIGIMICIWVMLGLYVAAAYLLDGKRGEEVAAKVKQSVSAQWRQCLSFLRGCPSAKQAETRCRVIATAINAEDAPLAVNEERLAAVMREVEEVGESARDAVERSHEALAGEITPLQERLTQLAQRCDAQDATVKTMDELASRLGAMERQIAAFAELPQQLSALQAELQQCQAALQGKSASASGVPGKTTKSSRSKKS